MARTRFTQRFDSQEVDYPDGIHSHWRRFGQPFRITGETDPVLKGRDIVQSVGVALGYTPKQLFLEYLQMTRISRFCNPKMRRQMMPYMDRAHAVLQYMLKGNNNQQERVAA